MTVRKALEDIVVLDLTKVLAGPYCGSILADFGAKVIKIELPGKGDDARAYAPFQNGESLYYGNLNRNKYGMTLNLKTADGKAIFQRLVRSADVLIENNRPGVMDGLGIGYQDLRRVNPRLVYGSITGFGSTGPYSARPGYDIISQAMGGMMSITGQEGDPPTRAGNAYGDILGGMNLVIGVLIALHHAQKTGEGQFIDISLVDSVAISLEQAWQRYFSSGVLPSRQGNQYAAVAPYDSFLAKDGWIVIGCGNQKLFELLCAEILSMPELITDDRFKTMELRVKNNGVLKTYIERWLSGISVEQAVALLTEKGIPAGPILTLEQIANDPGLADARGLFVDVDHPIAGKVRLNGSPIKLSRTNAEIRSAAPVLGQHNHEILTRLGYSQQEIDRFGKDGVI